GLGRGENDHTGTLLAARRPRYAAGRSVAPWCAMNSDLSSRVTSEKGAYNDGDVYARSAQLQRRFSHVFLCPNAVFTDRLFDSTLADVAQGRFVLEYGCFNGWSVPALATCAPGRILGIDISE